MNKIKQLQEEAREEFDKGFVIEDKYHYSRQFNKNATIPKIHLFQDTLIEQTYKQARKDILKKIKEYDNKRVFEYHTEYKEKSSDEVLLDIIKIIKNNE